MVKAARGAVMVCEGKLDRRGCKGRGRKYFGVEVEFAGSHFECCVFGIGLGP